MSQRNSTREWPSDGLESVNACPICACAARRRLHEGLTDHLCNVPGRWNLFACEQCGTAYLDPRPNPQSIHLAYENYFTHGDQLDDDPQRPGTDWLSSLKQAVLRAYIRTKFGNQSPRVHDGLAAIMWPRPWLRRRFDGAMRHLPIPKEHSNVVLDIGCGNGRFLCWARTAGWRGVGTEFDPQAASLTRAKGFEVHEGSLESLVEARRLFDAITISHVIEHVHKPRELLNLARQLLKPGGYFWIETPNIYAHGHDTFGNGWAGLHPPHHLQVFTRKTLEGLLKEAGFIGIRHLPWQPNWKTMAILSRKDATPTHAVCSPRILGFLDELISYRDPVKNEFVTLAASVPPGST